MIETLKHGPNVNKTKQTSAVNTVKNHSTPCLSPSFGGKIINFHSPFSKNELGINTKLSSQKDVEMYNALTQVLAASAEQTSPLDNISRLKKLDTLLKNGTLLKNNSNDNSTTLENLYKISTEQRTLNFDNAKILGQTIDALYAPETITQVFGDIPPEEKAKILQDPELDPRIRQNPSLLDVTSSGTCVSASFESHLARRHPAEFARWAQEITSPKESISFNVNASAFNPSYLEAYNILRNMFEIKPQSIDFNSKDFTFSLSPDKNAKIRAQIQNKHWDKGERNILDVFMQSTLMHAGSEQTYNTLIDKREGKFNSNPEGLGEFEKIFLETIIEGEERLSMVYQKVDVNQNLVGWGCDFATIQKHIIDTLNTNDDVIIGYVLTNETSGDIMLPGYVNTPDNAPNKIINGHEITIVDYKQDKNGDITFICNDTDDGLDKLIEYPADYLIPKIHHAGYAARIVEADYDRITNAVYGGVGNNAA